MTSISTQVDSTLGVMTTGAIRNKQSHRRSKGDLFDRYDRYEGNLFEWDYETGVVVESPTEAERIVAQRNKSMQSGMSMGSSGSTACMNCGGPLGGKTTSTIIETKSTIKLVNGIPTPSRGSTTTLPKIVQMGSGSAINGLILGV